MQQTLLIFLLIMIISPHSFAQTSRSNSGQAIRQAKLKNTAYEYVANNLQRDEEGLDITENDVSEFNIETSFGDLTGDGEEEVAVFVSYYVGGTGASGRRKVLVYTLRNGELQLLDKIDGGDRAFGGIRNVSIKNGQLLVESFTPNSDECAVCYGGVALNKYEYLGRKLVKVQYSYVGDLVQRKNPKTGYIEWVLKPNVNRSGSRRKRNR